MKLSLSNVGIIVAGIYSNFCWQYFCFNMRTVVKEHFVSRLEVAVKGWGRDLDLDALLFVAILMRPVSWNHVNRCLV
jgi:hypothetical protein